MQRKLSFCFPPIMQKRVYVLDGNEFSSWDEFDRYFGEVVLEGCSWGENLNAFNDVLRGGFGTPEEGFILRWIHSDVSRARLNQMIPNGAEDATLFDVLVEIIRDHGEGGKQAIDGVELELL